MILCCCSKYFFARRWSTSQPPMSTQNSTRCDSKKSWKKKMYFSPRGSGRNSRLWRPKKRDDSDKGGIVNLITARANSQLILRLKIKTEGLCHLCHSSTDQIHPKVMDDDLVNSLTGPLIGKKPNTYTYTKVRLNEAGTQNFYPVLTSTRSLWTIIEVYCPM